MSDSNPGPNVVTGTTSLGGGSPVLVGASATSKVGFYGVTAVVQPADAQQATITATWATISSGFGFAASADIISMIAVVKLMQYTLKTLGLWKGAA